jgi:hypothetical protein
VPPADLRASDDAQLQVRNRQDDIAICVDITAMPTVSTTVMAAGSTMVSATGRKNGSTTNRVMGTATPAGTGHDDEGGHHRQGGHRHGHGDARGGAASGIKGLLPAPLHDRMQPRDAPHTPGCTP